MQGDLFSNEPGFTSLGLKNASVLLWRQWLDEQQATKLLAQLKGAVCWSQPSVRIAGKEVAMPRLQAWYGDEGASYKYSGQRFEPMPWLPALAELKCSLEQACDTAFNSVLVNWYRGGQDSVAWHADDEPELGLAPIIASLSIGATRRFMLRPKRRQTAAVGKVESKKLDLSHGDLLLMTGSTQQFWNHCVPKTQQVVGERLNLTFRYVEAK